MGLRISRKVFKMKTEIIDTISECSRYSPSEINTAFDYVGSFDLVVVAVRVADSFNVPLIDACNIIKP